MEHIERMQKGKMERGYILYNETNHTTFAESVWK